VSRYFQRSSGRSPRERFKKAVTLDPVNPEALSDLFEYYLEAPRALGGGMDKAEGITALVGRLDAADV
jgi:hypothetical protein